MGGRAATDAPARRERVGHFREFELEYDVRPPTTNHERSAHWTERREYVELWREWFGWKATELAKTYPPGTFQYLTIEVFVEHERGPAQDIGAAFPAVKAAIDGLVDGELIPDDSKAYIRELSFYPPEISGNDRLILKVRGWLA
jgi:hypothetical protein